MKAFSVFDVQEREINRDTATDPYDNPSVEAYCKPIRALSPSSRYEIVLIDARGQVRQHAMAVDRNGCLIGLRAHGFVLEETGTTASQ